MKPEMQDPVEDPEDAAYKGEFSLGRLRYRSPMDGRRGRYFRWGIDANKGDRLFLYLRRVTRVDISPVETVVDAGSEAMFDLPWMFAVSVGDWKISGAEAKQLRQYFDRGGFLMVTTSITGGNGRGLWRGCERSIREWRWRNWRGRSQRFTWCFP